MKNGDGKSGGIRRGRSSRNKSLAQIRSSGNDLHGERGWRQGRGQTDVGERERERERWSRKERTSFSAADLRVADVASRRAIKDSFRKLKPVSRVKASGQREESVRTREEGVGGEFFAWRVTTRLLSRREERMGEEIRGTTG